MDVLRIANTSRQYVKARITANVNGATVDPTADVVRVAFVAPDTVPQDADFHAASWETDTTVTPNRVYARCLVGPGGTVQLAAGLYEMWIQVTDNPEQPVLRAGLVAVA